MFCTKCGKQLPEGSRFCTGCGNALRSDDATTVAVRTDTPTEKPVRKKRKMWPIAVCLVSVLVLAAAGTVLGLQMKARADLYEEAQTALRSGRHEQALELFLELGTYKDSPEQVQRLQQRQEDYENALSLEESGDLEGAQEAFSQLDDYRDSEERARELKENKETYETALALVEAQRYEEAQAAFEALGDFRDSAEWAQFGVIYEKACQLQSDADLRTALDYVSGEEFASEYREAAALFDSLGDYRDAPDRAEDCRLGEAIDYLMRQEWDQALTCAENLEEENAAFFRQMYLEYCADDAFLEDMVTSLAERDLLAHTRDDHTNADVVNLEYGYLEKYRDLHFADAELELLFEQYMNGLDAQEASLDSGGDVEDLYLWYMGSYQRYGAVEQMHEMYGLLDDHPELQDAYLGEAEMQLARAELEPMLEAVFREDPELRGTNYYYDISNPTDYSFTVTITLTFCQGSRQVWQSTSDKAAFEPGETWNVPVPEPDAGIQWDSIWPSWSYGDIYLDGKRI